MSPRFGGETTGFESDWLISGGRGDGILVYAIPGVLLWTFSQIQKMKKPARAASEKGSEPLQPERRSLTENYFDWLPESYEAQVSKYESFPIDTTHPLKL